MEDFCRELFEAEGLQLKAPPALTLFEVYVDPVAKEFRPWKDVVKPFSYDPTASYFEMMVPTVDTTRFSNIFSALITQVIDWVRATDVTAVVLCAASATSTGRKNTPFRDTKVFRALPA